MNADKISITVELKPFNTETPSQKGAASKYICPFCSGDSYSTENAQVAKTHLKKHMRVVAWMDDKQLKTNDLGEFSGTTDGNKNSCLLPTSGQIKVFELLSTIVNNFLYKTQIPNRLMYTPISRWLICK